MKTALIIGAVLLAMVYASTAQSETPAFTDDFAGEQARFIWEHAQRGNAEAQGSLGTAYLTGQGVPQNYCKALSWYRKAGRQGYANAQAAVVVFHLRKWCSKGDGKDLVRAYVWLTDEAAHALLRDFFPDGGFVEMRGDRAGFLTVEQLRGHFLKRLSQSEVQQALRIRERILGGN